MTRRRFLLALLGVPLLGGALAVVWPTLRRAVARSDAHRERILHTLVDRMLPGGDLPGAAALGIGRTIESLCAVAPRFEVAGLTAILDAGVEWLDARAGTEGATSFLALGEARQFALMNSAFEARGEPVRRLMIELRFRAFTLYFAEPAVRQAFAYTGPAQPEGFPDFRAAPTG